MRGKVHMPVRQQRFPGITPAYAGKSMNVPAMKLSTWDHPRVCGEKVFHLSAVSFLKGSPPRMRGKVASADVNPTGTRITPAYAGKSSVNQSNRDME